LSDVEWLEYCRRRRGRVQKEVNAVGAEASWLIGQTLEHDPYVSMCKMADYAAFYFGRPGGEPQVTFPRFEFLDGLRRLSPQDRATRVARATELIITGVHMTKWTLDREHNFMTDRRLPRLVPYVVYEAHEKCKALGHKLEYELMQAISQRLSELKAMRGLPMPRVETEPMPIDKLLARLKRLEVPPSEQ